MSLKELSNKKIYLTKEFISYSSSLLHLPIFTSLHSKVDNAKYYTFEVERYWGFNDVSITAPWLSIKYDFKVFSYILRMFYKNYELSKNPYEIDFSIDNFLKDSEIKTNRIYYIEQMKESIEKLSKITIHFTKDNERYCCRIINPSENGSIYNVKQLTGSFKIHVDHNFINFFKHDPDLILNIDQKELDSINGDFAKILYTFYKTNQQTRVFEKDIIIQRLKPDADKAYYRKVFDGIKSAHKSLIECGFIKDVKYKKNYNIKEISHFEITLNDKFIIKETKKEEEEKKKKEAIKPKRPNLFGDKKDEPVDDDYPF
ncbi:TPA: hypothetical protein ACLG1F_002020 [Pseudomonas aeruginosa]|nr:hypothetical protein [Pseudomonas aeruginosa]EMB2226461.1 hypothetical protein [Pseudomonas aeruginosa]EME9723114.1 hypothetical protein [Pseudomonas aeruginosa]HCF6215933.1 hypothetical protein [Pseudomonas aeruginosa]HCF6267155.1 hypothetical protein [Pseudomonas aeruginosa]